MAIEGIKFGDHELSFVWSLPSDAEQQLLCRHAGQPLELTVSFKRPEGMASLDLLVDGEPLPANATTSTLEHGPESVRATLSLRDGRELTLATKWSPMPRGRQGGQLRSTVAPLTVYPPLNAALEGPGAAVAGRNARVYLRLVNHSDRPRDVRVALKALGPGGAFVELDTRLDGRAQAVLTESLPVGREADAEIECLVQSQELELRRRLTIPVGNRSRRLVVYCGFLATPLGDTDLLVHHVPANYAVRRPDRLLDVLPDASALILTDQQDAVFTPALVDSIRDYVERGGRLLFFCYWSAAWGRGFHHTYCSIARTQLPELLPLAFQDQIGTTKELSLEPAGATLWSDLPWETAPPLDYNAAELRPGATSWARADDGRPVAAERGVGRGRVAAIGVDCFGFGYGTLVHWPGQRQMLKRALDWLFRT
jgi:hypothetical protein